MTYKGEMPPDLFARVLLDTKDREVSRIEDEIELPYGVLTMNGLHIDGQIVCTDRGSWIDEPEYDQVISTFDVDSMHFQDKEDDDLYSMTEDMVGQIFKQLTPIITE